MKKFTEQVFDFPWLGRVRGSAATSPLTPHWRLGVVGNSRKTQSPHGSESKLFKTRVFWGRSFQSAARAYPTSMLSASFFQALHASDGSCIFGRAHFGRVCGPAVLYGVLRPRAVGVVGPDGSWFGVESAFSGAFGGRNFRCSSAGEAAGAGARFGRLWVSPNEVGERFGSLVVSAVVAGAEGVSEKSDMAPDLAEKPNFAGVYQQKMPKD